MEKELEVKLVSFVELMKIMKEERGRLELTRDEAITQATKLRISRIEEKTHSFDQSLIIGGENGSVYRGFLRSTVVPIKMLQSNSLEGCSKFQVEVDILSRMRHPNLFPLIGACLKASTLVYDYFPNGSLEGRLVCKDDTPPLPWQTRMRISIEIPAAYICSIGGTNIFIILQGQPQHTAAYSVDVLPAASSKFMVFDWGCCNVLSMMVEEGFV
ncbi:hypothetical protein GIB67_037320 [Kingdonia uniflora]|uniref:RING-type E3 ubiquitin transferase n=1 Tax=Kingdonia uniflora TaxID=39325 RepID=A0A7J7MSE1_9MAGN|nr:hypothetical protein GIB67_037320 [Kingdonia uniflora]